MDVPIGYDFYRAYRFACDYLKLDKYKFNITFHTFGTKKGMLGYIKDTKYGEYEIGLSNSSSEEVLFHELVHLKQFLTKEFWYDTTGELFYNTQTCHYWRNIRCREYRNLPWEKGANKISERMLKEYND